jgi:hypothetical protein
MLRQNLNVKLHYLVLKHTKSKLTNAISKLFTKIGNLGLKVDLQNACRAKLGTVTRKPLKLETKYAFLS